MTLEITPHTLTGTGIAAVSKTEHRCHDTRPYSWWIRISHHQERSAGL